MPERIKLWADKLRSEYADAMVCRCREHKCTIKVDVSEPHPIFKGENITTRGPVCDCIIFNRPGRITISLIELKSSSIDAEQIRSKFERSGSVALKMLKSTHIGTRPTLICVLAAKSYRQWIQHERLKNIKIRIDQKEYPIRLFQCGESLKEIQADI